MSAGVWLPKQFGAWAMLVAPVITGVSLGGLRWETCAIAVAWITAYLGYMAVRGVIGSKRAPDRRRRYATAAVVYLALAAVIVAALLWWHAALLWWGIPLAVSLGGSLALIVAGRERSVLNDALLIGASCLMAAVTATAPRLARDLRWGAFTGAVSWPVAWLAAAALAGYFWGTIFYVKTMIRERGKTSWYASSVAYHCAMIALAALVNWWVVGFAAIVAARAIAVPKLWPRAKPRQIGIAEIVLTAGLIVILATTLV